MNRTMFLLVDILLYVYFITICAQLTIASNFFILILYCTVFTVFTVFYCIYCIVLYFTVLYCIVLYLLYYTLFITHTHFKVFCSVIYLNRLMMYTVALKVDLNYDMFCYFICMICILYWCALILYVTLCIEYSWKIMILSWWLMNWDEWMKNEWKWMKMWKCLT